MPNKLIYEKSLYLQQHAHNPVDWYPWTEEAFEKAKRENKPIFLSIGYSTCHWCHVMERESFEDPEIARLMNETFINIKVDREERPDIDQVYMDVCLLLTGRGGWPLTIIMTPDKKPFFAGTYFPKESRYGMIGLKELIQQINKLWHEKREDIEEVADRIIKGIKENRKSAPSLKGLDEDIIKIAYTELENFFDETNGGFKGAPKFPVPHNFLFLLRYYKLFKEDLKSPKNQEIFGSNSHRALHMVRKSLIEMRKGGIYDHVGGGFHRYSTDSEWLLPHFEKMLYDQAMHLLAYAEIYQITKEEIFEQTVKETIEYLIRDMKSPEGAFYSAEDADSEGEEGKFYTWPYEELKNLLGDDFEIFAKISNIKEEGNYLDEATKRASYRNIIHISKDWEVLEKETNVPVGRLKEIYSMSLRKLLEARKNRIRPAKDTKILTDWNSLIISALSRAGVVFEKEEYIKLAKDVADFLIKKMYDGKVLYHRYSENEVAYEGNLDDYAFFSWGLFELYQATFEDRYLESSYEILNKLIENFWDAEGGGFFFTPETNKELIFRQKKAYDGAYPSGNSIAYNMLVNFYKLLSDSNLLRYIEQTEKAFLNEIKIAPSGYSMFLTGFMNLLYGFEIIFSGERKKALETRYFIEKDYIPLKVLGLKTSLLNKLSEFVSDIPEERDIKIYICKNFACQKPVASKEEIMALIS